MQARLRTPYVSSRGQESTKLCYDFAMYSCDNHDVNYDFVNDRGPM